MNPARRAAWDAYLAVRVGLLPDLGALPVSDGRIAAKLAGLGIRIRQHAPLWPAHGGRLVVAVGRARELQRAGDRAGLTALLRVMLLWLFRLSRGTARLPGTAPGSS
ncbi:hypothetical protein GA0070624_5289 [Micromonospora rhizosphaerae]|uniref:Uncharacterized protein n=1 Tax=Micromonospora rhizosphaerae TaxID=568872 RepID=A0A1C6T146_9ACTN|nr:hypothetical protein GA0070624_5289 [Micromonospora rhizosphaerae]